MLQRSYVDYQYESLYSENSVLRQRVRKMSEIQPYVQLLLQNNKKYQDDIKELQIQNNKLRGRVDSILQETLLIKQAHKNQLVQIKSGFESDIERLIRELKDILRDKQAMQDANRTLIEELSTKSKKDLELKKRQLQQLQIQTNRKIGKLNDALKNKEKIIEEISQQFSFKQNNLLHDIDELNYKINMLTKDKEHMAKEIEGLSQQKRNLTRKNKQLLKQNQQVSTKWLKCDQQKSETLLQMKNKNIELSKINSELQQKLRFQQRIISEQNRKNGHLIKQCDDIMHLKNQIQTSLRRTVRSLEDLKAEHAEVVSKLDIVSKTTDSELKKQGEQLQKLSQDNKKLNRQNIQIISENKDKISQIQDLIRAIQKQQRKIADLNQKCTHLQQQNLKKNSDNKSLTQKLEDALLQKKSLNQKVTLYSNHNLTLQQMLEKQKRRNACLQTSRFQIETIAMGALSKPQQICRQYERQIQKIVQQFLSEKQQIEANHNSQIMHLKLSFEQALKEKDEYFARKIAFLEKQMISLRSIK